MEKITGKYGLTPIAIVMEKYLNKVKIVEPVEKLDFETVTCQEEYNVIYENISFLQLFKRS